MLNAEPTYVGHIKMVDSNEISSDPARLDAREKRIENDCIVVKLSFVWKEKGREYDEVFEILSVRQYCSRTSISTMQSIWTYD